MNGRVYDYNVGRFMSVDPFIHALDGSQGINPYSYIMNNPLAGTDPTGYAPQTGSRIDRSKGTDPVTITNDAGDTLTIGNGVATLTKSNGETQNVGSLVAFGESGSVAIADFGSNQMLNSITVISSKKDKEQASPTQNFERSTLIPDSTEEQATGSDSENPFETEDPNNFGEYASSDSSHLETALERLRSSEGMSKRDLGPLINFVRGIISLGTRIEDNEDIFTAIQSMDYAELQILGAMVGFTHFGLSENYVDMIRVQMQSRVSRRQIQAALSDVRIVGKSATELIYVNPAMNAVKRELPSKARKVVDAYQTFESLRNAVGE